MKESTPHYSTKMLGVVTLYNPDAGVAASNIRRYAAHLDKLIVWDNSPLEKDLKTSMLALLADVSDKIEWKGDGDNYCIAKAINYAWHYAQQHDFDLLLIMDQDSQWESFALYRQQIEKYWAEGNNWIFTPYIAGDDRWIITKPLEPRRIFINSGTVVPVNILTAIGGADEAFPLDALDHDMSYRALKANFQIFCLTCCILYHTVGRPRHSKRLHLFTNDYGRVRTYTMTKGHIMNYRRHRYIMTCYEKRRFFKEIFMWKIIRMVLIEDDKVGRFRMFFKGIRDGVNYKF